jgi:hypothetical protein
MAYFVHDPDTSPVRLWFSKHKIKDKSEYHMYCNDGDCKGKSPAEIRAHIVATHREELMPKIESWAAHAEAIFKDSAIAWAIVEQLSLVREWHDGTLEFTNGFDQARDLDLDVPDSELHKPWARVTGERRARLSKEDVAAETLENAVNENPILNMPGVECCWTAALSIAVAEKVRQCGGTAAGFLANSEAVDDVLVSHYFGSYIVGDDETSCESDNAAE